MRSPVRKNWIQLTDRFREGHLTGMGGGLNRLFNSSPESGQCNLPARERTVVSVLPTHSGQTTFFEAVSQPS